MRIALVSEHADPLAAIGGVDAGGQNVYVAALATALGERGHEVVVHTRRWDPSQPARVEIAPGVRVEYVEAGPAAQVPKDELPPYMPEFTARLAARWEADPPDVVHAHFWMSGQAALRAAGNVPVVQTFHALGAVKRRWQGAADTSPPHRVDTERQIGRSADAVLATCRDEVNELRAMGVPEQRIVIVPCGVDLGRFRPDGPKGPWPGGAGPAGTTPGADGPGPTGSNTPGSNTPGSDTPGSDTPGSDTPGLPGAGRARVLSIGRLVPRKGVDTLVQAMRLLPRVELVIAGGRVDDEEAVRLRELADGYGLAGRVRIVGSVPRDEVPALMRAADALVTVPWYEPFGMVPVEAMACGVPVIASAVGGHLDTVAGCGLLVPPRRPRALARALKDVLADPGRRRAMGAAGARRARQRYGWPRVAERTEAVYTQVIDGRMCRLAALGG
ncbi:glycosyltransferase [Nonomuraea sp. SMC257]|uniref:Glycosyltransferase n=1 Tax=Nonomuraea montanisoli TaxID=2741721 RepID=A0A7Y6I5V0_9ACTN|nr:glycosyltransferase [Nonomuraea montanisoli]NUW32126.1 glycosyltransferase [Nonomuraea montanisoli]